MLVYGDSPIATTGLGRLHKILLKEFAKEYEITVLGLNHQQVIVNASGIHALYDEKEFPYKIVSTYLSDDPYGVEAMKMLLQNKYDIIFTSHDINRIMPFADDILKHKAKYNSKWVMYTPIDRKNVAEQEESAFTMADMNVFLSDYALNKIKSISSKTNIARIWHPVDAYEWRSISAKEKKTFRKDYFLNFKEDDFIIGNINRNQFRKDVVRSVVAFKEYRKINPKAKLYLHTTQKDDGGDIAVTFAELNLTPNEVALPNIISAGSALKQDVLSNIMHSLDLAISTSTGEGFGYTTVEAMMCKIPVLMPNNTSFTELVGDRGYLADCNDFVIAYGYGAVMRDIVDTKDMIKKMDWIYNHPKEAKEKAQEAQDWVKTNLSPQLIFKQWQEVFNSL